MTTCEGVWMWIVTEREASVQGVCVKDYKGDDCEGTCL